MPYIPKSDDDRREALQNGDTARNAGELNYQLFYYVKHYDWRNYYDENYDWMRPIFKYINNFLGENPNYQRYNDMTGVMVRCYKEIYRRLHINLEREFLDIMEQYDDIIADYEDTKIDSNGDVE